MSTLTLSPALSDSPFVRARTVRRTPSPAAASPVLRLTRRGRLVMVVSPFLMLMVAAVAFGSSLAATDEAGEPVPTRTVVVGEGDTLWEIAATVAEPGETRDMVHRIIELNALPVGSIQVGQEIAVPLD